MKSHLCECNLFVVVAIVIAAAAVAVVLVVVVVVAATTIPLAIVPFLFFTQNILLSSVLAISIAVFFISIRFSILFYFILFAYVQNNHFDFSVCLFDCGFHLFMGAFCWVWLVVGCVCVLLYIYAWVWVLVFCSFKGCCASSFSLVWLHIWQYKLKIYESFILKSK